MTRSTRMWLAGGLAVLLLCGFAFNRTPLRDRWSDEELKLLASMQLGALPPAPADASNRFERSPAAAALGRKLFHDVRLSANGQVACATCHAADRQFQDGLPVSKGVGTGTRRSMPIVAAAHGPWKFWDGRKDSLWSQALGPLEDAAEHATTRVQVNRLVRQHYRDEYERVFGRLPDMAAWPADAGPLGTPEQRRAWAATPAPVQAEVNRVFANVGKAIAAYERTVSYGASRFDRYVQATLAGDAQGQQALSPSEVRGLRAFIGPGQCATCHNGPLLTDQHFHNTGVPQRNPARPDLGRAGAIAALGRDEFNCMGPHSDADKTRGCEELRFLVDEADPALKAAFKTPSLRNVALRPPYMHAGQLPSLQAVVAHYAASPAATVGHSELAREGHVHAERQPIRLSDAQLRDLVSFLEALSGPVIDPVR